LLWATEVHTEGTILSKLLISLGYPSVCNSIARAISLRDVESSPLRR
jgi:hypothetical protein